jgi:phage terminase small subunit
VNEYLVTGVGYHAAIAAGYKPNQAASQASRLLTKNANVARAVAEGQAKAAAAAQIKREEVIAGLRGMASRKEDKVAVAVVRALELLGKEIGMFKESIEVTGEDGGPVSFVIAAVGAVRGRQDAIEGECKALPEPDEGEDGAAMD